jgi:hypothetical protein
VITRSSAVLALAVLLAACGGTPATAGPGANPTTPPAATQAPPGGATPAPPGGGATQAPGGGSFESLARALVPPGSTEVTGTGTGNFYQLISATNMSLPELAAFYSQQIPALGLTETGRYELQGTLTIALANPDGGILIVPGNEEGQNLITVSLGTSS